MSRFYRRYTQKTSVTQYPIFVMNTQSSCFIGRATTDWAKRPEKDLNVAMNASDVANEYTYISVNLWISMRYGQRPEFYLLRFACRPGDRIPYSQPMPRQAATSLDKKQISIFSHFNFNIYSIATFLTIIV